MVGKPELTGWVDRDVNTDESCGRIDKCRNIGGVGERIGCCGRRRVFGNGEHVELRGEGQGDGTIGRHADGYVRC